MHTESNLTLKSLRTKKQYKYSRTPDGSGKRLALAQLEADDKAFTDAANARAGRVLSERELIALANEQPKREPVKRVQFVDDGKTNHHANALNDIRNMPARTPDQRRLKKAALAVFEEGALRKEQEIADTVAREERLADPEIVKALAHAEKRFETVVNDSAYSADEVAHERSLLDTLRAQATDEATHSDAAQNYYSAASEHNKKILSRFREAQRVQREALDQLTEAVKKGELELAPIEQPATPPPTSATEAVQRHFEANPTLNPTVVQDGT